MSFEFTSVEDFKDFYFDSRLTNRNELNYKIGKAKKETISAKQIEDLNSKIEKLKETLEEIIDSKLANIPSNVQLSEYNDQVKEAKEQIILAKNRMNHISQTQDGTNVRLKDASNEKSISLSQIS